MTIIDNLLSISDMVNTIIDIVEGSIAMQHIWRDMQGDVWCLTYDEEYGWVTLTHEPLAWDRIDTYVLAGRQVWADCEGGTLMPNQATCLDKLVWAAACVPLIDQAWASDCTKEHTLLMQAMGMSNLGTARIF